MFKFIATKKKQLAELLKIYFDKKHAILILWFTAAVTSFIFGSAKKGTNPQQFQITCGMS